MVVCLRCDRHWYVFLSQGLMLTLCRGFGKRVTSCTHVLGNNYSMLDRYGREAITSGAHKKSLEPGILGRTPVQHGI